MQPPAWAKCAPGPKGRGAAAASCSCNLCALAPNATQPTPALTNAPQAGPQGEGEGEAHAGAEHARKLEVRGGACLGGRGGGEGGGRPRRAAVVGRRTGATEAAGTAGMCHGTGSPGGSCPRCAFAQLGAQVLEGRGCSSSPGPAHAYHIIATPLAAHSPTLLPCPLLRSPPWCRPRCFCGSSTTDEHSPCQLGLCASSHRQVLEARRAPSTRPDIRPVCGGSHRRHSISPCKTTRDEP